MNWEEKYADFNPNSVAVENGNIFGFPYSLEAAKVVIIPIPWDVTTSYSPGTAKGPKAILDASLQLDFYDPYLKDAWKYGIAMEPISDEIAQKSTLLRQDAERYITFLEVGNQLSDSEEMQTVLAKINAASAELNGWVKERTTHWMNQGKLVGLLGGDHSTPYGYLQALAEKHEFGILQVDAHADLRKAYEGFEFSHASIFYNALKIDNVKKLVQVGIRDICPEEVELIESNPKRIKTFFDWDLKSAHYAGKTWEDECREIIMNLPDKVYISFDIDGLDPTLCPNTGTPVAGGFQFQEIFHLINLLAESKKQIIGFDLCEVSPAADNDWNENVGARVLFKLCNLTYKSQNNG